MRKCEKMGPLARLLLGLQKISGYMSDNLITCVPCNHLESRHYSSEELNTTPGHGCQMGQHFKSRQKLMNSEFTIHDAAQDDALGRIGN